MHVQTGYNYLFYDYDYDLGIIINLKALFFHLFNLYFEIFIFIMPEEKFFIKAFKIIWV